MGEKKQAMPKKSLGQHFLASPRHAALLVDALGAAGGATVLEIGPGRGALTLRLLDRGVRVVAVEMDRDLAPFLDRPGLTVHFADARRFPDDIPGFLRDHAVTAVLGNLPYNVGTHIFLRFLPHLDKIERMVLTFQKEVAEKVHASPGTPEYGALSVLARTRARIEWLGVIPPGAFLPPPKVDSAALRLTDSGQARGLDWDAYSLLLGRAFGAPRKTLWNNLKPHYDADRLHAALAACGLPERTRPHQAEPEAFKSLLPLLGGA
jgi:16S rRNA (adenine1518-N6/adenine1519-N6)-dimethyltransferase